MNGLSVIFTPLFFYYAWEAFMSRMPFRVFRKFKRDGNHLDAALWDLMGVIFLILAALSAIVYWRMFWVARFFGYADIAEMFQSFGVTINFLIRYVIPLMGMVCLLKASELYWHKKINRIWPNVVCIALGIIMLIVLLYFKAQPH